VVFFDAEHAEVAESAEDILKRESLSTVSASSADSVIIRDHEAPE